MALVEDPEVDPAMSLRPAALLVVLLLLAGSGTGLVLTAPMAHAAQPATATTLHGNITGPSVLATGVNQRYLIQATGGPAVAPNGTIIGNLTYYASVSSASPTGVQITPESAAMLAGTPGRPLLTAGPTPQTLTITVELVSVLAKANATLNLTYVVQVVQPYVLTTEIVNPTSVTAAPFPVLIDLDGTRVGNVSVPSIIGHEAYNLSFSYATVGLSSGWHTFSISLSQTHGLLRFENGSGTYTQSFYVPGAPTSYTLWYVTGAVAFVGVLFIFGARVSARRRGPSKK